MTRSVAGEQNLLPIWHGITQQEVRLQSASLADKFALSTSVLTPEEIAHEISEVVLEARGI